MKSATGFKGRYFLLAAIQALSSEIKMLELICGLKMQILLRCANRFSGLAPPVRVVVPTLTHFYNNKEKYAKASSLYVGDDRRNGPVVLPAGSTA
jgi:hypothetical protein